MSYRTFRDIMMKFEQTVQVGVLSVRRIKGDFNTVLKNMAAADVESSTELLHNSDSAPTISHTLYALLYILTYHTMNFLGN